MSSYESFSGSSQSSQDSSCYNQSLGSQDSYGSQSLETWNDSYESSLLMIVVSPLGLIVSQARNLSKLLPTPNWGHQQK